MIFGKLNGKDVEKITLSCGNISADILTYGGIIQSLKVLNTDVVLGYNTLNEYVNDDAYMGAIIGRVANCIENGKFCLNGKEYNVSKNNGKHSQHGGFEGFNKKIWNIENVSKNSLLLSYLSKDGEEGYSGNFAVKVKYTVSNDGLEIDISGISDKDTIVNMTSHSYFNLNGENSKNLRHHKLYIDSENITPVDKDLIPHGEILNIKDTDYDFTELKSIDKSYDINYVLNGTGYRKVAKVVGDKSGIEMEVYTNQKGLQFYTANDLTKRKGKYGYYNKGSAFCLEPQGYPNAINCPNYLSIILRKDILYKVKILYKFKKATNRTTKNV